MSSCDSSIVNRGTVDMHDVDQKMCYAALVRTLGCRPKSDGKKDGKRTVAAWADQISVSEPEPPRSSAGAKAAALRLRCGNGEPMLRSCAAAGGSRGSATGGGSRGSATTALCFVSTTESTATGAGVGASTARCLTANVNLFQSGAPLVVDRGREQGTCRMVGAGASALACVAQRGS
jgi:hypothetical protein